MQRDPRELSRPERAIGVVEAPAVVVGVEADGVVAGGAAAAGAAVPMAAARGVLVLEDGPASFTSATASTPMAIAAMSAIPITGNRQLGVGARRVRAAAPQRRHQSCSGAIGFAHSGHASAAGGGGAKGGAALTCVARRSCARCARGEDLRRLLVRLVGVGRRRFRLLRWGRRPARRYGSRRGRSRGGLRSGSLSGSGRRRRRLYTARGVRRGRGRSSGRWRRCVSSRCGWRGPGRWGRRAWGGEELEGLADGCVGQQAAHERRVIHDQDTYAPLPCAVES